MLAKKLAVCSAILLFVQGCFGQGNVNVDGIDNTLFTSNWQPFDCRRTGASCNGEICNFGTGECQCTNGSPRRDCLIAPTLALSQCPDSCSTRGECYDIGGTPTCYCTDPQYGNINCDRFRAFVECGAASMQISVFPQMPDPDFIGRLSIRVPGTNDLLTGASCQFPKDGAGSKWGPPTALPKFRFLTNLSTRNNSGDNPCLDGIQFDEVPDVNDPTQTRIRACYEAKLQYSTLFQAGTDETFRMCCTENAEANAGVTVGTDGGNDTGADVTGVVGILSNDLVYTSKDDPIPPNTVLSIGDRISYKVEINSAGRYQDMRLEDCTAYPGGFKLVTDGCPDPGARSLVVDIRKSPDGKTVRLDLTAWLPETANSINITCATDVCLTSCGAVTTCTGTNVMDHGRRKRDAETDDVESVITSRVFYIGLNAQQNDCPVPAPCTIQQVNSVYIPIAIVFGVLLLVALAISVFLCMRFRSKEQRQHATSEPPKAYFNASMT